MPTRPPSSSCAWAVGQRFDVGLQGLGDLHCFHAAFQFWLFRGRHGSCLLGWREGKAHFQAMEGLQGLPAHTSGPADGPGGPTASRLGDGMPAVAHLCVAVCVPGAVLAFPCRLPLPRGRRRLPSFRTCWLFGIALSSHSRPGWRVASCSPTRAAVAAPALLGEEPVAASQSSVGKGKSFEKQKKNLEMRMFFVLSVVKDSAHTNLPV